MSTPTLQRPPEVKPVSHNGGAKIAPAETGAKVESTTMLRNIMIVALVVIVAASMLASWIQTGAGAATVQDVRFVGAYDGIYSAYLWVPNGVTTGHPAPGILAAHGFNNSKEYMANTALELARRGYVVLSIDLDKHGFSTSSNAPKMPMGQPTANGRGALDGLVYLRSLDIVDKNNIGMIGMSMGGMAIDDAAQLMPDGYKAMFFMDSGCDANCSKDKNFAMSVGSQTEVPPNFGAPNGAEIVNMPGAMKAFGTDKPVVPGQLYGSIENGTGKIYYTHFGDHPISTDDTVSIRNAITWFGMTLKGASSNLPASDQIWPIKVILTGVAFVAFILFLVTLGGLLLHTSFFRSLQDKLPDYKGNVGVWWWVFAVITALLGPVLLQWAFLTFFMPNPFQLEPVSTGFVGWLMVVGILTVAILIAGYYWMGRRAGANGVSYGLTWEGEGINWGKIGKSLLLALTVVAAGYVVLYLMTGWFKVDFRFWVLTLKTTDPAHFPIMLWYLLPLALYFISIAVVLHGTLRPRNGQVSVAREMITNVLVLLLGMGGMLAYYYIPLTYFGAPSNFGPGGLALINGIALLGLLPAVMVITTYFFRKTGHVYVGAFINTLFVVWYLVAANTIQGFG